VVPEKKKKEVDLLWRKDHVVYEIMRKKSSPPGKKKIGRGYG